MAATNSTLRMNDVICYTPTITSNGSVWVGRNPLSFSLPLFTVQVVIVALIRRIIVQLFLKPLRQPRVLAEIIGGIVLGPSVMGRATAFSDVIFPPWSRNVLDTIANVGLLCFVFLIGVEMDITVVRQTGQRAMVIGAASMALPFIIGVSASFTFQHIASMNINRGAFLVYLGVVLSVTAFPVVARILAEIKLLNSEIGRLSMSAAIINDVCAWVLLPMSIAITQMTGAVLSFLYVLTFTIAFVVACFYYVRPAMWLLTQRIPEGQTLSDFQVCLVLTGMMLAALITDVIGVHAVFGAFVFGLAIPNGTLGDALIDKLETFVTGLLLPLYFVISGLKMDLFSVRDGKTAVLLVLVFVLACVGKVAGTVVISLFYSMPLREGLALGFLMNTRRGLLEMIVLNIGRDKKILDEESFAMMLVSSLVVTAMVTPAVTYLQRQGRRLIGYKRRCLQLGNPDAELRVLVCVHNTRNVPSIISLLNISSPTKRSPIFDYALHLVELTGRASAILNVHNTNGAMLSRKPVNNAQAQSNHIFHAFQSHEQHTSGVFTQTITIVSPYASMHEDICNLAEEKHIALMILPFHKQQTVDGGMEPINRSIKTLNTNMLCNAPCSVGILIDRGLSSKGWVGTGQGRTFRVALLFFGGPDDREALAYAWRMAENPGVILTVARFIVSDETGSAASPLGTPYSVSFRPRHAVSIATDSLLDEQLDEEYMAEFLKRNAGDELVQYTQNVVSNMEETVTVFQSMESTNDLFIVGRRQCRVAMRLMGGFSEWAECPELGTVGDLLASADYGSTVSVLVVQQYMRGSTGVDVPVVAHDVMDRLSVQR